MPKVKSRKSIKGRRYTPYTKYQRKYFTRGLPTSIERGLSISRGVTGFPSTLRTILRYHDDLQYTSATGAVVANCFRANSLFDPDETNVGHQPMFFDQYSAVYGRYVVRRSIIQVTFTPTQDTASSSDFMIGIVGNNANVLAATPSTNCEQQHNVHALVNGRLGGPNQKTLTLEYTPEDCLNITYRDTDAGALTNANPDQTYKFLAWAADLIGVGSTKIMMSVDIFFDVEFSQNVNVVAS